MNWTGLTINDVTDSCVLSAREHLFTFLILLCLAFGIILCPDLNIAVFPQY